MGCVCVCVGAFVSFVQANLEVLYILINHSLFEGSSRQFGKSRDELCLRVVLAVVVETGALLLLLSVFSWVGSGLGLIALLVQSNAFVDLVQALLDFGRDWGWGWDVVTGGLEALLVSSVLDVDDLKEGDY